ncbi:MAG: nuclease [Selenomonadaceae bacterium]|nr:nuclease [Selenomonadaceae bacterium]
MATDSETVDGVLMDDDNASYDKAAKRFLSMKILLAWILKYLVAEFRDSSIKEIAEKYIEGDPALTIGTVPVDSDLTNAARKAAKKKPGNIKGSRNEDGSATEGMAIFDIMFRAIVPATGEAITLIINIEPQRTVHTGYSLVRRGIYYACRMISSQKEVEFTGEDYDNIKKVYTIWLVMDAPKGGSNSIRRYEIKEKILHGHGHENVRNYDLMVAIMVYLGNKTTKHRLLKLLHLIFLDNLKAAEKKMLLKRDYDLVLTPVMEEELMKMGSLALGIAERAATAAAAKAEKQGKKEGMRITMDAIRMLKDNLPLDTIIQKTGMTLQSLTELKAML